MVCLVYTCHFDSIEERRLNNIEDRVAFYVDHNIFNAFIKSAGNREGG